MLSLLVHAGVDDQAVEPRCELRASAKLCDPRHQFEKDLLRNVARRSLIAFEVIKRDGVNLFLIGLKEQLKGIPVATLTGSYHALSYLLLACHSALLHSLPPRPFTSQTVRRRGPKFSSIKNCRGSFDCGMRI